MKTVINLAVIILLSACSGAMRITSFRSENIKDSEPACKNPVYVSSIAKKSVNPDDLSLYQLLKDAQNQVGGDVTIQNIHWDVKANIKVSVIYDVVRCGPEKKE